MDIDYAQSMFHVFRYDTGSAVGLNEFDNALFSSVFS